MCLMTNIIMFTIVYQSLSEEAVKDNIARYFLLGSLIASFLRDRIEQFVNKFYTFLIITITSWTIKKQRRHSALVLLALNFLLMIPFGLIYIGISALLSSPLMALFTFPIYFMGNSCIIVFGITYSFVF